MQKFDVIVVGAGPAGCECARHLTKAGRSVLLLEKAKDFSVNSYSSGGAPLEILEQFDLPAEVVNIFWNNLSIYSPHEQYSWNSSEPLGVVLDFAKLRQFLTQDAQKKGLQVMMQTSYMRQEKKDGFQLVHAKNAQTEDLIAFETKVLVDATGSERNILAKKKIKLNRQLSATGIEYHVEVPSLLYQRYDHTLSFYLGKKWMPHGYAWIFPFRTNILKVGIIRYFADQYRGEERDHSYKFYLERMMENCLGSCAFPIIEKHGKTLSYTYKQQDLHFQEQTLAIGDAISTLNPLAAEGIRHAMASARIASHHILAFLEKRKTFALYPASMKRYYGFKWRISETLMKKIYQEVDQEKIDLFLKAFKKFSFHEIIQLAFFYKFSKVLKFYFFYIWAWIKRVCFNEI